MVPMLAIILLSHTVTLSTASSLADCATNLNRIEGGGMYALSKLSLGKAMGGSIGIPLYLAQAASVGFYCIGFAEPLHALLAPLLDFIPLFQSHSPGALLLQKQFLATLFLILFFMIVMAGADFTLKIQLVILVVLIISVGAIFLSPLTVSDYGGKPLFSPALNLSGNRTLTVGIFFLAFTQFFPAVTGISTGIGMSGDLKTPGKSIVEGTFSSILITMVVYVAISFVFASIDKELILTGYEDGVPQGVLLTNLLGLGKPFPASLPGIFVLLGVLFATSSSALSVFMTGPRTVQFLARDNILPKGLGFLEKDFHSHGEEPRFAVMVTFFFGLAVIWMGSINVAATVVGILFLVVYGWVNGAAFLERVSRNPSFRPTFKGHWLISLYGFLACFAVVCLFNWKIGVLITLSQFIMFRLILKFKTNGKLEGVWWGALFTLASQITRRLRSLVLDSRNWRPLLLTVSFATEKEGWKDIDLIASHICSYGGLARSHIIRSPKKMEHPVNEALLSQTTAIVNTQSPTDSVLTLIQSGEMTGLNANTVLLEYNGKVDLVKILNGITNQGKNTLLFKGSGRKRENLISPRLDIWWRGERNGNLMALLAYIINGGIKERENRYSIRILRMVGPGEDVGEAHRELDQLFGKARISGEIRILPHRDEEFSQVLREESADASLIMMGIPGNYTENNRSLFRINEFFFHKEIGKFEDLPPILFTRSIRAIGLTDD